jgi:hypothetical protein
LSPLIILNILALPYVLFSIYYQAVVIKQWCILCLAVQSLLLAEFLSSLFLNGINAFLFNIISNTEFGQLLLAYFFPVLLWLNIKPYLYNAKENDEIKYNFRRFKNNPEIFNSLHQKQATLKNDPAGLGIILGDPGAENTLVKVCNPYCGPCAKSFPHLEELLINDGSKWKVQIIFTARPDKSDYRALPVAHFLQIRDKENNDVAVLQALGDWYNAKAKNYDAYIKRYPISLDFEGQKKNLAGMYDWCNEENIQFTPTYYVNGSMLLEHYSIEDLKNIFT